MEVDFIVVDSYSPYTAIVARPWLHALGAVSSTLHQKVKYPMEGLVKEILGSQSIARQCMVAAILYKPEAMPSAFAKNSYNNQKLRLHWKGDQLRRRAMKI